MADGANEPDFWARLLAPRDPAYRALIDDELIQIQDAVHTTAYEIALAISPRRQELDGVPDRVRQNILAAPDVQLAVLHVLHQMQKATDHQAANAARLAGHTGMSYTKLGAAWGLTRQAARLKWPEAVPPRGRQSQETVEFAYADGSAVAHYDPETGAWWYIATGADDEYEESEPVFSTSTDATAAATAFLIAHSKPQ
ncbi:MULTISPECIES: hypothetical protein [unclassified Streptomyces]|uniref:hypothetical protein n=1 Tax=unclassified Streptomyces TaxID=2593676 RepID=UPI00278C6DD4|nr:MULTISPECIES: hypothetical protein [unclassified Streptomyces]